MNDRYSLPDPEQVARSVAKIRRVREELEEFGLELAEINARLEADIRQQKLQRLQKSRG
jgi:hypothetical protein